MKKRLLTLLVCLPIIASCGEKTNSSPEEKTSSQPADSSSEITSSIESSTEEVVSSEEDDGIYTITYVLNGGENNASNPETYTEDTRTIILYSATLEGMKFDGWFTDETFETRISRIPMGSTGDLTLYAKFSIPEFKIVYVLNGGENAEGNPEIYTPEDEITLLPATNEKRGVDFDGWYKTADFSGEKVETIPLGTTGNMVLYAKYDGPRIFSYTDNPGPVTVYGRDIMVNYLSKNHDTYLQPGLDFKAAAEEGTADFASFEGLYDDFIDNYYALIDEYRYAGIIADTTADLASYNTQDEIYSLINEMETLDQEIDIALAASPYRNLYFENMTDDEIDEYIASLDPETSKQANEIQDTMNNIISRYSANELDPIDAIKQYSAAANQFATLNGYTNYLEYAYENVFDREYTVEESSGLFEYTDVIYGLFTKALRSYSTALKPEEQTVFDNLNANFWGNYMDYTDSYAELVGGDNLENYNGYFTSGNYFYSANPNDNVTAYVGGLGDGTPIMFMGPDNQDVGTFIHEFGHYNAQATDGDIGIMDLSETQSQANEMLFYLYLKNSGLISKEAISKYLNYKIAVMANTVLIGALINELEKVIYGTDISDLTQESLYATWDEICTEAGVGNYFEGYKDGTIELILLNYHGYYISYATSAVAALEFYSLALEDYDAALAAYRKVFEEHEVGVDTFTSVLVEAGVYGVFTDEAYELIAKANNISIKK